MHNEESVEHPLWARLRNWRDWQIILEAVELGGGASGAYDNEGTIEVADMEDAENVIEPVLAKYKLDEPKKFKLILNHLLNRTLIVDDEASLLGINRMTYYRWRADAIQQIQKRVDQHIVRMRLLQDAKEKGWENGNRLPRGQRGFT